MSKLPLALGHQEGRAERFDELLKGNEFIIAPGVYDCITARLAEVSGHHAAYITGSGLSMSRLGAPDVALLSFGEILDQIKRIADVTALPLLADADTGYGGPLNVMRTVKEFESAGVVGIQIEDQEWPKKCGHEPGRKVVSPEEMVARIKAAVDARRNETTLIIARTDARTSLGLTAAIDRAHAYGEAGADILFVESPESEDEMRQLCASLNKPCLANQVEGGRTPMLHTEALKALGYRLVIYPNSITRMIGFHGQRLMKGLAANGSTSAFQEEMFTHRELWDLFDYPAFTATEQKYQFKKDE